jgi:PAS domain S-box-containing protein
MDRIDITALAMSADLRGLTVEVALLNDQGLLIAVNEAWQRLSCETNYPLLSCAVGASVFDACSAARDQDVATKIAAAVRAAQRGERAIAPVSDLLVITAEQNCWRDAVVSAQFDDADTVTGVILLLLPATERKLAESAIERSRNRAETRLSGALARVALAARTSTGVHEVYQAVVDATLGLIDAHGAFLNFVDESGETVVTVAAGGEKGAALLGHRMPISSCLSGDVILSGESRLVADATKDKLIWQPAATLAHVGSTALVPVHSDGVVVGVLAAATEHGGHLLSHDDLHLLGRFADQVAPMLDIALRFRAGERVPPPTPRPLTDRRRTPAPLTVGSDSEAAIMVEASPDGMILTDGDGTILLVNGQIESVFGYSRSELIGRPVEVLMPERFRDGHIAHRERYRLHPMVRTMGGGLELLARRKDGSNFPVEVSLSPATAVGPARVVATVRDITARQAVEAQAQAVLHTMDATRDAVVMFFPDTLRFTYVNQGAMNQLGFSRDELMDMTPLQVMPEFDEQRMRETLQPLLTDELHTTVFSTFHRRKDGRDVPVEVVLEYPPAAGGNKPRMLVALARDITERLEAARTVAASEAAWRAAFDDAPVGMAMASLVVPELRALTNANEALCDMLGYSREELLTRTFAELTHPDDRAADDHAARQMRSGERQSYATEKRYLRKDGQVVWATLHSTTLLGEDGRPDRTLAHIVDITNRKQAEAAVDRGRRWLVGLGEIRAGLLAAVPLEDTLDLVCLHARNLVQAETALMSRPDRRSGIMHHIAADSAATRDLVPETFVIDEPVRNALAGTPFLSGHVGTDDRILERNREGAPAGMGSVMIVPVRGDHSIDSLLFLSSRREHAFDAEDLALVASFAAEAATAVRLNEARQQQARLRVLEERERLGKDLHDVVIQRLFAAGIGLQSIQNLIPDTKAAQRVEGTIDMIDQAIVELRSTIFRLNMPVPLAAAREIRDVIDTAALQFGFAPQFTLIGDPESVPVAVVEQLLPSMTEALSNVLRHAQAKAVAVTIVIDDAELRLTVADNGVGFDSTAVRGNGLNNLESRAARVGGASTIEALPSGGTLVTWTAKL